MPTIDDDLNGLDRLLRTTVMGRCHRHYPVVDSTNDVAARWAKAGCPNGALVTADEQRAGRGRRGRVWISPRHETLCASVVLRPGAVEAGLGAFGLAVGAGLRLGLSRLGLETNLKWPNDIEIEGRKLGGILCEAKWSAKGPEIVTGFGINVHNHEFCAELRDRATSVALAGFLCGRARLLAGLLGALESTLTTFFADGFAAIRGLYEPYCTVLGRTVVVDDPRVVGPVMGVALDSDGALQVEPLGGGARVRIEAADVWLAPPQ